eukprot:XP_023155847.1 UDP-glycosyltransferase 83A1 [Zea mays]
MGQVKRTEMEGTTAPGPKDVARTCAVLVHRCRGGAEPLAPRNGYADTATPTGLTRAIVRSGATGFLAQAQPKLVEELSSRQLRHVHIERKVNIQRVIRTNRLIALAEAIICNTFREVEPEALWALLPNALPVGPLVVPMSKPTTGHFFSEDLTCLTWLDTQAPGSVIYVAFGSSTVFDATRFHELANGLVQSGCPFIWVVRPNFAEEIDEDWFNNRFKRSVINGKGLIVTWAPQQRVLSHPSVACFVTHCGWNSTMEAVLHGVPFLCCPYFADQFCNQSYVCNVWKTGLKLCSNEQGVVTGEEIKEKVVQLLRDEDIKARVAMWKNIACASIREGGSSHANLLRLVDLLQEG